MPDTLSDIWSNVMYRKFDPVHRRSVGGRWAAPVARPLDRDPGRRRQPARVHAAQDSRSTWSSRS